MYDPRLTQSVVARLAGVATTIRVLFIIGFAALGIVPGAVVGMMLLQFPGAPRGGDQMNHLGWWAFVGCGVGGVLGAGVAHLLVVGFEWAQQVLGALHTLATNRSTDLSSGAAFAGAAARVTSAPRASSPMTERGDTGHPSAASASTPPRSSTTVERLTLPAALAEAEPGGCVTCAILRDTGLPGPCPQCAVTRDQPAPGPSAEPIDEVTPGRSFGGLLRCPRCDCLFAGGRDTCPGCDVRLSG